MRCLERVFTRLAGVGLERLGEEARHRRLVIMIPDTTHDQETGSGVKLPREPAFRVLVHFSGRQRLCTSQTYHRHIKTQRDRADVSWQNINSDVCSTPTLLRNTAEGINRRVVRFVFRHQNPSITNDVHDLPQWFHVFCKHLP